jgi:signal transduction histidine kinase
MVVTTQRSSGDSPGHSEPVQARLFDRLEKLEPATDCIARPDDYRTSTWHLNLCGRPLLEHALHLPGLQTTVGNLAAQASQALRESQQERQRLSGLLVSMQEDERRRIALDLHDGLGQSLSVIKLAIEGAAQLLAEGRGPQALEALQRSIPRIKEAAAEVRRVSTELRPTILDDLGILPTLSWFFREFEAASGGVRVDRQISVAERDVPAPLQITLYRILQEAVHNVVKHAGADRVSVQLERIDNELHLRIEDNGCGFDPQAACTGRAKGLGLLSMKERASFSGGTYRLQSAPGQGTRIWVSWPCGNTQA